MGRNKTHTQYVAELAKVNPNIEVLGIYMGAHIKIPHRCKIDGYVWDITPANALRGRGCPLCAGHIKRTHEEYVSQVTSINKNIQVVDKYINNNTPILHKCTIHNLEWNATPGNILQGHGCPECGKIVGTKVRTKTHEQYIEDLKEVNPNVIPLEKYVNAHKAILHKCLIDNYEWKVKPNNVLSGKGCPKCNNHVIRNHNQYIDDVALINPNIEVIGEFINATTPILHRCRKHNILWNTTPERILYGSGCSECCKEKIGDKARKSHEQYVEEVKSINPNILVKEKYIDSHTPILHECLIDNYKWKAEPCNILSGTGCPCCSRHIKRTHEEYISQLSIINPNIEPIEEYITAKTPILHKCKKHNIEWKIAPSSTLNGCGCKKCMLEKMSIAKTKTKNQYIEQLNEFNQNIILVGDYTKSDISTIHKCLVCGYEWKARPGNILSGCGCPLCKRESKGERRVRLWLERNSISYESQKIFDDCYDIKPLPFDFYLPDYNLIIEYDGKQHFEPIKYFGGEKGFQRTVKHDNMKNEYCKNNRISLLRIPYNKNIEEELNNFLS